jgi:hypothetical protein
MIKTSLQDPRAEAVLKRLYTLDHSQERLFKARRLTGRVRRWFGLHWDAAANDLFLRDKLVALDPMKAELCYVLCRAIKATRIVEFATSFGVSTIYLAAAVRDNVKVGGSAGIVIGTENEPTKVIKPG